jgi:outer membrane protein insertion porin family
LFRKGLTSGCAVLAIASLLITGRLCPAQIGAANASADPAASALVAPESNCFGSVVGKIAFPGIGDSDLKMLRDMLPLHEGDALERGQLQSSLRVLFATGRFADLKAECDRSADGKATLSFVSSPNFFVGGVSVEGGPGKPSNSQIVNASKLQLGELYSTDQMDRALKNIQRLMEENGFYRSAITHSEHQNPPIQQVEIAFHVHSGDPARVGNITVLGKSLYSRGQIQDIAHLHPTDIVSAQKASNAIEKIHKKYQQQNRWLAQVSIAEKKYVPQSNTVDYTFEIEPGPLVKISVEGFRLSQGTVKRSVPVYEEGALDDDLLSEGQRNLLNHMQGRGYFDATVDLRREADLKQNELRVVYHIVAGEKHKVGKVEITGNKYFSRADDLRSAMQVQAASVLLPHGRYSQAMLRSDVRDLENKYRTNGFAQVKVESDAKDEHRGRKNFIAVAIHINEGTQTLVGAFQITGNVTNIADDPFPVLNTSPGQPFSDSLIAEDRDHLLNYYFNNGFPNATFEATAKPAAGNRMDVTFNLHEGERFYVNRVLVSGREFTKPYVIDHELQVRADDDLSQIDLLNTQKKLYDLGIFSQVDTAVQNPEGTETHKNVLLQVQEARRYTFTYGLGFEFQTGQPVSSSQQSSGTGTTKPQPLGSSGVSPLASLDVSRLNFLGRAHTITFESRVGRLQQRGLISYEAPRWLNNPNLKLTFTGFFDHTLDVTTFTSQRLEGAVQIGQVLSKRGDEGEPISTMDYRFNYRLVKATNVQIDPNLVPLLSLPVRVGEPGFGYIRNRRDNDLETTRGSYITVDAGVASHYFGSQADFSRVLVQNSTYHPFGKRKQQLVFARSTRVGVESSFGDTIITQPGQVVPGSPTFIPLPERFFMGGGNSHRGFGLNQAGPRDPLTGFPLGGSALFLNNFEVRFPPPTLPWVQDNLSFAVFHDMGNVFTDGTHMLNSLLHWRQNTSLCSQTVGTLLVTGSGATLCRYDYISHAIGLGIRYKTPVGPVRFDLGYNLNPTVYPGSTQVLNSNPAQYTFTGTKQASPFNVYFSIGQTF